MTRPARNNTRTPVSEQPPAPGQGKVAAAAEASGDASLEGRFAPQSSRLEAARTHADSQLKAGDYSLVAVARSLASIWSSATLSERKAVVLAPGREWSQLLTALAERGVAEVGALSTGDLAALTSDFVKLGIRSLRFFRAVSSRLQSQLDDIPMTDLAHTLRSFAELRVNEAQLFSRVLQRLEQEPRDLDSETLLNLAVALALPGTRHGVVGEFGLERGQQTPLGRQEGELLLDLALSALKSQQECTPQAVCDLLAAFASRGVRGEELLTEVIARGPRMLESFDRGQLLSLAESCGALGARYVDVNQQQFLQHLFTVLAADAENFSAVEAVRFFRAAEGLRMTPLDGERSSEYDPLAQPFERVVSQVLKLRDTIGVAQLTSLARSFRRCSVNPTVGLSPLQPRIAEVLSTATDEELATIVFVYSRVKPTPYAFISELATAATNQPWNDIEAFASFVASCARIDLKHADLFRMFPQIVLQHALDRCDSRVVARLLCAYVELGEAIPEAGWVGAYFDPYFFEALLSRLSPSVSELTSINLSNLARAVAECSENMDLEGDPIERRALCVPLIQSIADEIVRRLRYRPPAGTFWRDWEVSCQSIAVVTRALGMLGLNDRRVLEVFREEISIRVQSFKTEELCKIVFGLARLRYRDVELFDLIAGEAKERFEGLLSDEKAASRKKSLAQDACMMVWALANIHIPNERLCEVAVALCHKYHEKWKLRDRIQLAWSLGILKPELVREVCTRDDLASVNDAIQWRQAYHALLAGGEISHAEHFEMLKTLRQLPDAVASSRFEEEVFDELTDTIGIPSGQIERQAFIGAIPVDMVIGEVIIECDGDMWHYSEGRDGDAQMGSDFLQDRILSMAGYRVIHIRNEHFHANRAEALEPLLAELKRIGYPSLHSGE
jgi:very-short-patch-repair endonuclease